MRSMAPALSGPLFDDTNQRSSTCIHRENSGYLNLNRSNVLHNAANFLDFHAVFQKSCRCRWSDDIRLHSNNPYKLPDGSDAASAAAAELITSDSRYLFISKQSDTGRLKLQSQFLNPAFLQVAIEITRDSSVSKICNFRELSKRPEYMFACAVITRHLLERIALQRTGNFNESCSSALVYSEYMEMLANPLTKERMEAKARRFYSELETKIKNTAVEKQKCESDVDSGRE
ncbi:hypothetical protein BDR26DRAFT_897356 [Obelidium mucronatum]|nr:hypothetical protein BDR26DRAFT_897356 [Obelidium mucronatum]